MILYAFIHCTNVLLIIWASTGIANAAEIPAYTEPMHKAPAGVRRDAVWNAFLENYVSEACFRACWETWLPYDVDLSVPGYYEVYMDVYADIKRVMNQPSSRLCGRLLYARPFQRCYISQCAGLNAQIPVGNDASDTNEEGRLWAWTSEYVARYGPGPSSFENYRFRSFVETDPNHKYHDEGEDSWKPFPVGLTAACLIAPNETFSQRGPEVGVKKTMALTTADNRISQLQPLRKLLMPIWNSPNLIRLWHTTLPQYQNYWEPGPIIVDSSLMAATEFDSPRVMMKVPEKLIGPYIFSLMAYCHLLHTTSNSKWLHMEAIQLLAAILLPVFPVIQILQNVMDAGLKLFTGQSFSYSYLVAGVLGMTIFDEQVVGQPRSRARLLWLEVQEVDSLESTMEKSYWWVKVIGILINMFPLIVTVVSYVSRLNYRSNGATYCATTGFDHRLGWLAISSLAPTTASLILHIQNKKWSLSQLARRRPITDDWKPRVTLQIATAAALMELLTRLTGRITVVEVIFSRWLQEYSQFVTTALILMIAVLISIWQPLALHYNRTENHLRTIVLWLLLIASLIYATLIFLLLVFMDMEEHADLILGFVLPWNLRWEKPNPVWTNWWSL